VLFGLALRQRFVVVAVDGDSMWPTLKSGDRVLVRRAGLVSIRAGQIVVIEAPGADGAWATRSRGSPESREWIIKRVAGVPGDPRPADCLPETAGPVEQCVPARKLVLAGDNPSWSQVSRQWGYFPGERLLGVVVRRIHARSFRTRADGAPAGWPHDDRGS
jgi:signal peptidase I